MRLFTLICIIFIFSGCAGNQDNHDQVKRRTHPSHKYQFVAIDTSEMNYFETDYLPVYSDIYFDDGTKRLPITTTISIRNTSLSDSAWILSARYYDSYGKQLRSFIDSALLLTPLESIELVVEEDEKAGGAGANFIIDWAAGNYSNQLMIQSVMISTYGQQGVSFLSDARVIKRFSRK